MISFQTACCWLVVFTTLIIGKSTVSDAVVVELNAVYGRQFCPVLINCTWSNDVISSQTEVLGTVEIQRQSSAVGGIGWITIAACSLTSFQYSLVDTTLSTTGIRGVGVSCGQGQMSVAINSTNTTNSDRLACQVSANHNVTVAIAALSVNESTSTCSSASCSGGSLRCVEVCDGFRCVSNASCGVGATDCPPFDTPSSDVTACDNLVSLSNVTNVWLGSSLVITCVTSSPTPTTSYYWSRDSQPDLRVSTDQNLTFSSVQLSDADIYYCTMADTTCTTSTRTLLTVNWEIPVSSTSKQLIVRSEGDSLDLACNVTTRPTPAVVFYFTNSKSVANMSLGLVNITRTKWQRLSDRNQSAIGWVELRVTSVLTNYSGRYLCVAQLPRDMYYLVATYDVNVTERSANEQTTAAAAADSGGESGKSSSFQPLFDLWKIGVIVIGAATLLVLALVTAVVCKIKHDAKDNETAPLDDEEETCEKIKPKDYYEDDDDCQPIATISAALPAAAANGSRARNLPDRYYNQDTVGDDDLSRPRRNGGVKLPPIGRPAAGGYKPNVGVDDDNEQDEDQKHDGSAAARAGNRRQRRITASD